jgi:hypothetical protein
MATSYTRLGNTTGNDLDEAANRIQDSQDAGDRYTDTMESIRDELNQPGGTGTSVGNMVAATIKITEADIVFSTQKGLVSSVSGKVKEAAKKIGDS